MQQPAIGLDDNARKAVAAALARALADTYALYQKTHLFHWNVEGPRFISLHELFGTQYRETWEALDVIAERIRALGVLAPSRGEMASLATVDASDDVVTEDAMIDALVRGNEAVVRTCRAALEVAEQSGDQASADLMTQRCAAGEKAAWMLRAHLT